MTDPLLQTTVVGSYPQPDWLVNRPLLAKGVPRTRLRELWRVEIGRASCRERVSPYV